MKKLLLFSALLFTMGTTFATPQDDIAAVMAKTKYKNFITFLGDVSIHPDFCENGIVYETDYPIVIEFFDGYAVKRMYLSDTVEMCESSAIRVVEKYCDIPVDGGYVDTDHGSPEWFYYDRHDDYVEDTIRSSWVEPSFQNFLYFDDSLYFFRNYQSLMQQSDLKQFESPSDKKYHELTFIQLSYFKDKKVHVRCRKMYVNNTNTSQEINVKYELIDNDINGRATLTNLTPNDSVFYRFTDDWRDDQKFTKYLYFDTVPSQLLIYNYYKGCQSYLWLLSEHATEMPRIHDTVVEYVKDTIVEYVKDTIYITKTDTIYITKTDTVYIEKEPNKTAIINKQTNLNVWPNPTTTFVNAEAEEPFSYTLLNNVGVILKKEEGEPSYTISMKEYPDGVYYIKTSDGVIRKIVKK